jgi:hypothetical protein
MGGSCRLLLLYSVTIHLSCAFREVLLRPLPPRRERPAAHPRRALFAAGSLAGTRRKIMAAAAGALSASAMTEIDAAEASKAEVGWGIVGLGDVCAVKAGPAFVKAKGSQLVAVMRRTPGKAQEWAAANVPGGRCKGYSDLDAFLADPEINAVYIATPPGSHLEVARKVAASGKPAYIEKPVGRCYAETRLIAQAFAERGCGPAAVDSLHQQSLRALRAGAASPGVRSHRRSRDIHILLV